jgi:hypothetical protein
MIQILMLISLFGLCLGSIQDMGVDDRPAKTPLTPTQPVDPAPGIRDAG